MQLVLIIDLFIANRIKIIIGEMYFTFVIYIPDLQTVSTRISSNIQYFWHINLYRKVHSAKCDSKLFAKAVNKKLVVYGAIPLAKNSTELYLFWLPLS